MHFLGLNFKLIFSLKKEDLLEKKHIHNGSRSVICKTSYLSPKNVEIRVKNVVIILNLCFFFNILKIQNIIKHIHSGSKNISFLSKNITKNKIIKF